MDSDGYALMIAIFGAIAAFIITRELWLWYFGITRLAALLESIDTSLKMLPAVQDGRQALARRQAA